MTESLNISQNKIKVLFFLFSLFFSLVLLFCSSVLAINDVTKISGDLSIEVIIPNEIYLNLEYDSLFRIRNLMHETGEKENMAFTVNYQVYSNTSLYSNSSFSLEGLNSYKTSGTGSILISREGNYLLCGQILEAHQEINNTIHLINDTNLSDNSVCMNFSTIDPKTVPCNVSLDLELSKNIVANKEQIKIKNVISTEDYPYIIEYRISDLFGNLERLRTTENDNDKSFTPSLENEQRLEVYSIENELISLACNNSNQNFSIPNQDYLIVVNNNSARNNDDQLNNPYLELENVYNKDYYFGKLIRIRFKAYRGDSSKSTIKVYVQDLNEKKLSYVSQANINKKFLETSFTIPILLKDASTYKTGNYQLVIEGLDEKIISKIYIQKKKDKTTTNKTSSSVAAKKIISSFYTRNKKVSIKDKNINLYFNLKNSSNIILAGPNDYFENYSLKGTSKYSVTLDEGPNVFLLIAKDKTRKTIDFKYLFLLVKNNSITKVEKFSEEDFKLRKNELKCDELINIEKDEELNSNHNLNFDLFLNNSITNNSNKITGSSIYSTKDFDILPVLAGIIGILLLGLILNYKNL